MMLGNRMGERMGSVAEAMEVGEFGVKCEMKGLFSVIERANLRVVFG